VIEFLQALLARATRTTGAALIASAVCSSLVFAQPGATAIVDRVRIDTNKQIDFHAAAFPETLFVGQQTTYQLAVFLTNETGGRLRRNPEFDPPELRGLLSYEMGTSRRVLARNAPGYQAHVFQRALFPVKSGLLVVPEPKLSYALPQSSSYFSREERHIVRAESAMLVVRPLPEAGRPAAFLGAVGVLKATARVDTLNARVGDPLVLTLRVSGVGNVKLLPRPTPEIDWADAVPGTERVQVDSSGPLVRGIKEFDWILTPTREGRVTLPPIAYHYFDPYKRQYDVANTAPVDIDVRTGALAVADIGESAALLPLRASGTKTTVGSLVQRGLPLNTRVALFVALAIALIAPIPAIALVAGRRRASVQLSKAPPPVTAEALRRLTDAADDAGENARSARRALHSALASRLGVPPQQLTSRRHVRRTLRRRGVTRDTTNSVIALLEDLDARGFAGGNHAGEIRDGSAETGTLRSDYAGKEPTPASSRSFAQRVRECYAAIDAEALSDGSPLRSRLGAMFGAVLLFALLGVPAHPMRAQSVQVPVADSVSTQSGSAAASEPAIREATALYERRLFKDAADRFRNLALANPRDVDLLANWGTAAWSAGDTVNAVIAWQRAARLDPLASDLQDRISLLPAGARGGVADVPMIPVPLLQAAGLLLWLVGWSLAAWLALQGRRRATAAFRGRGLAQLAVWVLLVGGVAAGGLAWRGRRELDASQLSVVVRPETMHIAPGTDADAMGGVATGDVVRRMEEQGAWQHVEHADGRTGWLPTVRLVAIVADAEPRPSSGVIPPVVPVESLAR
jgi:hypothetical protein